MIRSRIERGLPEPPGVDMARARNAIAALIVGGAALPLMPAACTSTGCASGADSATAAATQFLQASVSAQDEPDVCPWVLKDNEAAGLQLAREISRGVSSAGVDSLEVTESPSQQEGAVHFVTVAGGDLPVSTFYVVNEGGRYLVAPQATLEAAAK